MASEPGCRATGAPAGAPLSAAVDRLALNRRHWLVFGVCAAGFFFDSVDLQLLTLVAPVLVRTWALDPGQVGVLTSAAMVGMLCGACLFGAVADRVGRRPAFQLTVALFALGSALSALAQTPSQLVALRFAVGLGVGGLVPVDTALMAEFIPARSRGRMIALWALAFPVGGLVSTFLVSVLLPHVGWRGILALGLLPGLLVLMLRRLIPETPQFLLSRGRLAEAEASARWIARGTLPSVADPAPGAAPYVADAPYRRGDAGGPAPAVGARRGRVRELFSRTYRRSTAVAWVLWFCWSFAYFGVTLWLPTLLVMEGVPLHTALRYGIGFQLAAIAGRTVMMLFADRLGRRRLILINGVAAAALMAAFGASHTMWWLVCTGYLLSFFQDGGFSGIAPLTPSLYPANLRATGVGWANAAGRVASMLAPLLVGALVGAHATWAVFAVFSCCFLCASASVAVGEELSQHGTAPAPGEHSAARTAGAAGSTERTGRPARRSRS